MKLSLSGRLVEAGSGTIIPVPEFLDLAGQCGYAGVDLRAAQLNAQTDAEQLRDLRQGLKANGLQVFEGAYSGTLDADATEDFVSLVKIIADLGGEGIRVGGDLDTLKQAARLAAPYGIRILYQMHTGGPFETIAAAAASIADIDAPNFGVMPEPANLVMAREDFTVEMFAPLRGHILGVHVQTLHTGGDAAQSLTLADGTEVRYERVPYAQNTQMDFATFFAALRQAGFDGFVNELEPCPGVAQLEETVRQAADFLRPFTVS